MQLTFNHFVILSVFCLISIGVRAQNRLDTLRVHLDTLAQSEEGLKQTVDLSITDAPIQDFIRGMAQTNNLNVNIDPTINATVSSNFYNVTVADVFIFLCKTYDLDITFVGSIMSFHQYTPPAKGMPVYVPKNINITYDTAAHLLSYDLHNDSLAIVVKKIIDLTQKNITLSPQVSYKLVSGYIKNMFFVKAMDNLAYSNDLKFTLSSDSSSYLLEKSEPVVTNNTSVSKDNNKTTGQSSSSGNVSINISKDSLISIEAADVPISTLIEGVSRKLSKNYFLFSEPKGNITLKISNVTYDEFLKHVMNGTSSTYRLDSGIYLIGDRNFERLRDTKVVQLKFRTVDKVTDLIPSQIKEGVDLKVFPDLNSLIMSGSQPQIDEIQKFILQIDKLVPVILIEVIIVDIEKSGSIATGIEAGIGTAPAQTSGTVFPNPNITLNSNSLNNVISGINGLGIFNLGKVTPNFYLTISALEQHGILKVRSTPKLATLNGQEANLSIGETDYYLETTNNIIGTQNPQNVVTQNYKSVSADLSVKIKPVISGDDQITLSIEVKQSTFTARISPDAPPGNITRDFQSMVRVKDGDMFILGGLDENSTDLTGSGIPILDRIPILKWFFSSRSNTTENDKLIVFIKPTIVN